MINLNNINFSEGIREQEIQDCFSEVNKQLTRERINIGGSGIVEGLQITLLDFNLKISSGSLIDKNGNFIEISESNSKIERPHVFKCEEKKVITSNGEIQLLYVPYNENRTCASQYETNKFKRNITIKSLYSDKKIVDIINIKNKTLIVDARKYGGEEVIVEYYYSLPRYDTIYIDLDETNLTEKPIVKIAQGTSSNSPDMIIPEKFNFIIGIVKIDPYTKFTDSSIRANTTLQKAMKQHRNISTNDNNDLIICGNNYKNLEFINVERPIEPKKNTIWYDKNNNVFKIWTVEDKEKNEDGYWKILNDSTMIKVTESKIWNSQLIKQEAEDNKIFKFKKDELNLRFTPGTNALTIIIDNKVLMNDQYDEIIDYTSEIDNSGIGFKLASPINLTEDTCVEVRVNHQVSASPKQLFQRTSTFIYPEDIIIQNNGDCTFDTRHIYITNNFQLEVFYNGIKLKTNEIIEGTDLDINARDQKPSKQFRVTIPTKKNDIVSYKITTNVYSYNSLQTLLGNAKEDFSEMNKILVDDLSKQKKTLTDYMKNTNDVLLNMRQTMPKGIIDFTFTKKGSIHETTEINLKSFINLFDLKKSKMLIKNIDYSLQEKDNHTIVNFINSEISDNSKIYVMGIKF